MQQCFIPARQHGCFTGYQIVAAPAVTAPVMTASAPPYEVEVITVMTGVDMTGAGVVSHNGKVISRANQAIITGRLWRWRTWRGQSWLGRLRSVTDLQCLQTFSKLMLVPCGNLFFKTFKFRCETKIGMNEMKTSEHDVSNWVWY